MFKAIGTNFTWYTPHEKKFWLGDGTTNENSTGNTPCQVGNSENYVIGQTGISPSAKTSIVHKATAINSVPIYVNTNTWPIASSIYMQNDAGNYLIIGKGGQATNYSGNIFEIELFSTPLSDNDRQILEAININTVNYTSNISATSNIISNVNLAYYPPVPLITPGTPSPGVSQTYTISGQSYGNGSYIITASTNAYGDPMSAFDKTSSYWQSVSYSYDDTAPYNYATVFQNYYTVRQSTTASGSTYYGEWIQIQLPSAIYLSSYTVSYPSPTRSTNLWYLVGSTDGTTWTLLDTQTQSSSAFSGSPTLPNTYQVNATTSYAYYRMIHNRLNGSTGGYGCDLTELILNTQEVKMSTNISTLSGKIVKSGSTYITGNTNTSYVNISTDLITWTQKSVTYTGYRFAVNGSNIIGIAGGGITNCPYSADGGNTWSNKTVPSNSWQNIVYGNNVYLICGAGTKGVTAINYSTDLTTWSAVTGLPGGYWIYGITYSNNKFIAVGEVGTIATSTDGISWTYTNKGSSDLYGVVYGGSTWVIIGNNVIYYSTDNGSTWNTPISVPSGNWSDIIYADGNFIAIDSTYFNPISGTKLIYSSDGIIWLSGSSGTYSYLSYVK